MIQSLSDILNKIQQRPAWETYHCYCEVQKYWKSVISPKFVGKTRPVGINRQVLWVATESSAIAQHLALQRRTLLKKLNPLLSQPLIDIRFSSAQWYNDTSEDSSDQTEAKKTFKPELASKTSDIIKEQPKSLSDAFEGWAEVIRQRSQDFPLCPQCQSPTELWELQRWSVCGYCASQKM